MVQTLGALEEPGGGGLLVDEEGWVGRCGLVWGTFGGGALTIDAFDMMPLAIYITIVSYCIDVVVFEILTLFGALPLSRLSLGRFCPNC